MGTPHRSRPRPVSSVTTPSNTPVYRWPQEWSIDKSVLKRDLTSFESNTLYILRFMGSSPSASDLSEPGLTEGNTGFTSADEAVQREHMPEEPRDPPQSPKAKVMSQGSTEAQLAELRAMMLEFAITGPKGDQGPTGERGQQGPPGEATATGSPRFNTEDVGFFDGAWFHTTVNLESNVAESKNHPAVIDRVHGIPTPRLLYETPSARLLSSRERTSGYGTERRRCLSEFEIHQ